ncbi:hypothetical protein HY572_03200, partial [Candidatus Micrarchaeota archaeon]|nr:hypothetical protein [Candidatus Micrarchaeota archaeon]
GGGGGGGTKDVFVIQQIPKKIDTLVPGTPSTTEVTITSYYTGFLLNVNITLYGIPESWYTVDVPARVGPISNTTFSIQWHIPENARGTYNVTVTLSGVGTQTAGMLKSTYSFELVLPSAPNAQPGSTQTQTTRQKAPPAEDQVQPSGVADATNYPLVAVAITLFIALLALHYYFTHRHEPSTQSNPIPEKDQYAQAVEPAAEADKKKTRKSRKKRRNR